MKTAFQTGPGFYAADTDKHDRTLAKDTMRIYCVRLEAYDLANDQVDLDTQFTVLFGMVDTDPRLAKALLKLGEGIKANEAELKRVASRT